MPFLQEIKKEHFTCRNKINFLNAQAAFDHITKVNP